MVNYDEVTSTSTKMLPKSNFPRSPRKLWRINAILIEDTAAKKKNNFREKFKQNINEIVKMTPLNDFHHLFKVLSVFRQFLDCQNSQ